MKADILGQLWIRFKPNYPRLVAGEVHPNDKFWSEFFAYNDLGLVLAFAYSTDLCDLNGTALQYVDESWDLLCQLLGVDPDDQYESLEELFSTSPYIRWEE